MKNLTNLIRLCLAFLILSGATACDKEDAETPSITLDKKVIISLYEDIGYGSGNDTTVYSTNALNFDKTDYSNINSINFVLSNIKTTNPANGSDVIQKIKIELLDLTNKKSILGSEIITDDIPSSAIISSGDIKNALPSGPINLGIRVINTGPNKCSWKNNAASLILYR